MLILTLNHKTPKLMPNVYTQKQQRSSSVVLLPTTTPIPTTSPTTDSAAIPTTRRPTDPRPAEQPGGSHPEHQRSPTQPTSFPGGIPELEVCAWTERYVRGEDQWVAETDSHLAQEGVAIAL